jgi:hypothetical protein
VSRPSTRTGAAKHRAPKSLSLPKARTRRPGSHAAARPEPRVDRGIRRTAILPGIATAALAAALLGGPALGGASAGGTEPVAKAATAALARVNTQPTTAFGDLSAADPALLARMDADRGQSTSRSDRRTDVDPAKLEALSQEAESGGQVTRTEEVASGDPREIAQAMLPQFGFSADQFSCLDSLWTKESGWDVYADNPTSSAYGIPQALPGEKMASAGADWATNPATQIRWGLGYIADSYGTPCSAWSHSVANNWY